MINKYVMTCAEVVLMGSGCTQIPPALPSEAVAFEVLAESNNSAIFERGGYTVRDEQTWATLWAKTTASNDSETVPLVDFQKNMVVGVFYGQRSTGGYSIKVGSIQETAENITVIVQTVSPAAGATLTQALTSPVEFVLLPTTEKNVAFEWKHRVQDGKTDAQRITDKKKYNLVHEHGGLEVAGAQINREWYLINKKGVQTTGEAFQYIGPFHQADGEYFARAQQDGIWFLIGPDGQHRTNETYDTMSKFVDNRSMVYRDSKF